MSGAANKLLDKMREKSAGWHPHDFHTLYLGFGFTMIKGKKHTIFVHPTHKHLRYTIPRHGELSKAYARDSVKLIEELLELEKEDETDE